MKQLQVDLGVTAYAVGKGVLRFNPKDPALYNRFSREAETISEVLQQAYEMGLETADGKIKGCLEKIFPNNDFQEILGQISLFAVGGNGKTVLYNLFDALTPILEKGAKDCVDSLTRQAVKKARDRRNCQ